MRLYEFYGIDDGDVAFPKQENFRYRAGKIYPYLRLCEFCLKTNRRCYDSLRGRKKPRGWKNYRLTQWK